MTHHSRKLFAVKAAGASQTSTRQASTRQNFAAAAPTGIAAARSSTTLALSMMVALRYLEGRTDRTARIDADALSAPAVS